MLRSLGGGEWTWWTVLDFWVIRIQFWLCHHPDNRYFRFLPWEPKVLRCFNPSCRHPIYLHYQRPEGGSSGGCLSLKCGCSGWEG